MKTVKVLNPAVNAKIDPKRILKGTSIVLNEKNPEYASIALESNSFSMEGGFVNEEHRVAFLGGKTEDLQKFAKAVNFQPDAMVEGKIIINEGFKEFYPGQDPKINPTTNAVITSEGKPVYRNYSYTTNEDAQDVYQKSDKVDTPTALKMELKDELTKSF